MVILFILWTFLLAVFCEMDHFTFSHVFSLVFHTLLVSHAMIFGAQSSVIIYGNIFFRMYFRVRQVMNRHYVKNGLQRKMLRDVVWFSIRQGWFSIRQPKKGSQDPLKTKERIALRVRTPQRQMMSSRVVEFTENSALKNALWTSSYILRSDNQWLLLLDFRVFTILKIYLMYFHRK